MTSWPYPQQQQQQKKKIQNSNQNKHKQKSPQQLQHQHHKQQYHQEEQQSQSSRQLQQTCGSDTFRTKAILSLYIEPLNITTTTTNNNNTATSSSTSTSDEQQQLLLLQQIATIFQTTYNELNGATGTSNSTNVCDPFFRQITNVNATFDGVISQFSGTNFGTGVTNPLPINPTRNRIRLLLQHHQQKRHLQDLPLLSNRTISDYYIDPLYILLEVVGTCKACRGNSPEFSLFDDTVNYNTPTSSSNIEPTVSPTTLQPTQSPTIGPSDSPTSRIQTDQPTTDKPSEEPSTKPTSMPTTTTSQPTPTPTSFTTTTGIPSSLPSIGPTTSMPTSDPNSFETRSPTTVIVRPPIIVDGEQPAVDDTDDEQQQGQQQRQQTGNTDDSQLQNKRQVRRHLRTAAGPRTYLDDTRFLQQEDEDCQCKIDDGGGGSSFGGVSLSRFQQVFQQELIENVDVVEFIDFDDDAGVDDSVVDVIPVIETSCSTTTKKYSTVYIFEPLDPSSEIVISTRVLYSRSQGPSVVQDIQTAFRRIYNILAQDTTCDLPIFRSISDVQFISLLDTKTIEFRVEGTCRTETCIESGQSLFDESTRRQRLLKERPTTFDDSAAISEAASNSDAATPAIGLEDDNSHSSMMRNKARLGIPSNDNNNHNKHIFRYLDEHDTTIDDEDEEETCYCRKQSTTDIADQRKLQDNNSNFINIGPPNEDVFRIELAEALRYIMDQYKLPGCSLCDFDSECDSNVCISSNGRCASSTATAVDNSKLPLGCPCVSNDDCPSDATCMVCSASSSGGNGGNPATSKSCEIDTDKDLICDRLDNCPLMPNIDQLDTDSDGWGNVCDFCPNDPNNDEDFDGVCGDVDNCPTIANSNQLDTNGNGIGDVCDNIEITSTFPNTGIPSLNPTQSPTIRISSSSPSPTQTATIIPESPAPTASTNSPTTIPTPIPTTSNPTSTPTAIVTLSPTTSSPTDAPVDDCIVFTYDGSNFQDLYDFCNAHTGDDRCCDLEGGSCRFWQEGVTVTLCKGSCRGSSACMGLGFSSSGSIIEPYACQGFFSCYRIARNSVSNIVIKTGACVGRKACEQVVSIVTNNDDVYIGENSCVGEEACFLISYLFGENVMIGDGSCQGYYSCRAIGTNAATDVVVESNSCNAERACGRVGVQEATSVDIGSNACNGVTSVCETCGNRYVGPVIIPDDYAGTCNGNDYPI